MNNFKKRGFFRRKKSVAVNAFISTWNTANTSSGSSSSNQIRLPLISSGTYDFLVDWGDGNSDMITSWDQAEVTHDYSSSGTYTITITGKIKGWQFGNSGDRLKILNISNWGNIEYLNTPSTAGTYHGCTNLDFSATDSPIFVGNSILGFFRQCTSLIGNSSINDWDVSGLISLGNFFTNCSLFNQPLSNWDVSNVNNFTACFFGSAFNQDIGSWDVSNAIIMSSMFRLSNFNNNGFDSIKTWDVSNVTNFGGNNIGMFQNCPFNQPINDWDVGSANTFQDMFRDNNSFNQDLNNWDVSNASNFIGMFRSATSFNKDISEWVITNATNLTNFMVGKSTANYSFLDNIYNSWSLLTLKNNVTATFGNIQYTSSSASARQKIIDDFNWTITDGGEI